VPGAGEHADDVRVVHAAGDDRLQRLARLHAQLRAVRDDLRAWRSAPPCWSGKCWIVDALNALFLTTSVAVTAVTSLPPQPLCTAAGTALRQASRLFACQQQPVLASTKHGMWPQRPQRKVCRTSMPSVGLGDGV
jgi:hypothetical protein